MGSELYRYIFVIEGLSWFSGKNILPSNDNFASLFNSMAAS